MGFLFFFRPHLNRWDLARWAPISHDEISHGCDPHRCCFFLHLFDFSSDRVKWKKTKRPFLCHPTTTITTTALPDPLSAGELSGWWELSSLYNRKWGGDETYGSQVVSAFINLPTRPSDQSRRCWAAGCLMSRWQRKKKMKTFGKLRV